MGDAGYAGDGGDDEIGTSVELAQNGKDLALIEAEVDSIVDGAGQDVVVPLE